MKKAVLYSILALVMVLGLTLSMAVPVVAQGVTGDKEVDPDLKQDEYYVGDTIYYVMTVRNPEGNPDTITLINIWDELPDGSEHYFVQDGVNPPLILQPGGEQKYYISYTIRAVDLEYVDPPVGDPYYGVRNKFFAEYGEGLELDPLMVQELTEVLQRQVGGTASPVSSLALLAPWIILAGVIAGGAVFVWSRRAQSRA